MPSLLLTGACSGTTSHHPSPATASTATPAAPTTPVSGGPPFGIGVHTETFVDTSRPTPANGSAPALASRKLPTIVYYPTDAPPGGDAVTDAPAARRGRPFPLVVLAHGASGFGSAYQVLLRTWASHGYVVAAPTFPLSSLGAPGGSTITDYVNQPKDVDFVLSRILAEGALTTGPLGGAVDPSRVGVAGHSLGAITVLGLLDSCCRDPRIKAVISMAGAAGPFGPGTSIFVPPPVPVLFVHDTADALVSYQAGRTAYAKALAPKWFVTLTGANHVTPFLGSPTQYPAAKVVDAVTTDFLDAEVAGDRSALARLAVDANVAGVATLESTPG